MNAPGSERGSFSATLGRHGLELRRTSPRVLQVNVGKLCNQTCSHCHVGAGPGRSEIMSAGTADEVLAWIAAHRPATVDVTGGAPELCPEFRRLVRGARAAGAHVIVRCNLTVIFEPGQADLPEFYRDQGVELVCSLPCYGPGNVDLQRGQGVFEKSIRALRLLNGCGFGVRDDRVLTLVYNPVGACLPPDQATLEQAYRTELRDRFGIEFHRLHCMANLPITRYRLWLEKTGKLDAYQRLLEDNFNPDTVPGLMCRDTISVGWTGELYDCDFNQMLGIPMGGRARRMLRDLDPAALDGARIATGSHCYGCAAGAGSSCGGAVA